MSLPFLRVEGAVHAPRNFDFMALTALPGQIPDVSMSIPGREGGGVALRAVLETVGVQADATHVTLRATDGDFSASLPLDAVMDRAIVMYRLGDEPLPDGKGGPVRFLIAGAAACGMAEVDTCANVKFLGTIQVTVGTGVDTRPTT